MEHSKGKLKAEQGIGRQYFLEDKDNNTVALVALRANAHRLVTCWNEHDMLARMAGQTNMALCVYRGYLERNSYGSQLNDIDKELQALELPNNEYDTLKAKAALHDELVEACKQIKDGPDSNCAEIHLTGEYQTGLFCGLEDRDIVDRYDACIYGFEKAVDRMLEWSQGMIEEVLAKAKEIT